MQSYDFCVKNCCKTFSATLEIPSTLSYLFLANIKLRGLSNFAPDAAKQDWIEWETI